MSREQEVRTRAGQIGVGISKSRVRTPRRKGYGLYRVRPKPRSRDEAWEIEAAWTAYAFALDEIARAVEEAIGKGDHRGPADLRLRTEGVWTAEELGLSPEEFARGGPVRVSARWTSAYRGRRNLGQVQGESLAAGALGERQDRHDGAFCVVRGQPHYGPCSSPVVDDGSERSTPRSRQRAHNQEFHQDHLRRRVYGLKRRHEVKLSRGRE